MCVNIYTLKYMYICTYTYIHTYIKLCFRPAEVFGFSKAEKPVLNLSMKGEGAGRAAQ